jgi:hypothetical protein
MLLRLTMLPWPLAAIPGASAPTRRNRANIAGEHLVERGDVELCGRAEQRDPGVVDQDVDVTNVAYQVLHVGGVAEVGSDEAGLAAGGRDLLDRLGAAYGVAAVNQDLGPVAGQLQRDCATDARRGARYQRPLPFEVVFSDRRHCCSFRLVGEHRASHRGFWR